MKRLLTFFSLILLLNFQAKSQITITGTITDTKKNPIIGCTVQIAGTRNGTISDLDGKYEIKLQTDSCKLIFSYIGYDTKEVEVKGKKGQQITQDVTLEESKMELEECVVVGYGIQKKHSFLGRSGKANARNSFEPAPIKLNTERYDSMDENKFKSTKTDPISVFSVDVDRASYSNIRRFINNSQLPPKGSVRIEEMINYFEYDYPEPQGADPVSLTAEITDCPWETSHQLMKIGLQAKKINTQELPYSHIVFLIDVSGSMYDDNKLPLLIKSFNYMTGNLRKNDKVSLITYASGTDIKLTAVKCDEKGKEKIIQTISELTADGYTAGGEAIQKAYKLAKENFIEGGNNRIILATDGDFNVGQSSDGELKELVKKGAKDKIFLTVLGFGMYNLNDRMMETIADAGNGNYAYIDNLSEAKKALGTELWGTLYTVAKDVKILVDFNPEVVKSYRLVGYEDRLLDNEDFNDDKKDAGDMGSGHSVTALYELITKKSITDNEPSVVESNYVKNTTTGSSDWCTIKFRYKNPDENKSKLVEKVVTSSTFTKKPSDGFKLASSAAMFGMLLNDSKFSGETTYKSLLEYLKDIPSDDKGYIDELKVLVRKAKDLK